MGVEARLDSDFFPWEEPQELTLVGQLHEIPPEHRAPPSRSVIRICRLDQEDQRVFEGNREFITLQSMYRPRESLTVAYDHYRLDVYARKTRRVYRLDHPLLVVALGIKYGGFKITSEGRTQEHLDSNLRPDNPDLVEDLFLGQAALQAAILKALTGTTPEVFCIRENRPEHVRRLNLDNCPTIAGPNTELITLHAYPRR